MDLDHGGRGLPPGPCTGALRDVLALVEGRWKLAILVHLFAQSPMRFSELSRALPDASEKMLAQQLRALESGGVITRKIYPQVPPKVEYSLTELGLAFRPVALALLDWSDRYREAQDAKVVAAD